MRRVFCIFLAALLSAALLCAAGCSKKSALDGMNPDDPLLIVNGQVIMTVQDLQRSRKEQEVSHQVKGTALRKEKELFLQKAELRLLSYYAEKFELGADRQFLETEYDAHIIEIEDTEVYGKEKEFFDALQQELGMSDQEYKDWNVQENLHKYNAENLLEDLAATYSYIIDPIYMEEVMLENLLELLDFSQLELSYSGVQKKDFSFQTILSQ